MSFRSAADHRNMVVKQPARQPGVLALLLIAGLVCAAPAPVLAADLYAWGYNADGELGNGTTVNSTVPLEVSGLSNVMAIAGGYNQSLALNTDGTVWAWGDNIDGELGNGTTTSSTVPVEVSSLSNVTAIAGGELHSMALKTDGTVWAWGDNQYGQLGNGTTTNSSVPVAVSGVSNVTAIVACGYHSLALKTDGTVWAWGYNDYGELGNGTTTKSTVPLEVSGLSNVTAIGGGFYYSVALKMDGTVWAWGYNADGELGDGTTSNSTVPVEVSGISNVTAIAGGSASTLALKTDGTAWAWGYNVEGQLGNGTITNSTVPVSINGLSNITAISGGGYHSLGLKADGTVWAWGGNTNGQLGDGTNAGSSVPVLVRGLSNVTAISGGGFHTLALSSNTTFTWNGGVDDWFNLSAWTPHGIPGPGDTAIINGGRATANSAVNVAEIDIATPVGSALAELDGTAPITVTRALTFANAGGILHGSGKVEIEPGAAFQINSAQEVDIDQRTVDLMGSGLWTGNGVVNLGSGAILNNAGAFTIQITNNGLFGDGSNPSFNNTGTLTSSAGDYAEFDDVAFNNSSVAIVTSGSLQFDGGGMDSGSFQANGGSFEFGKGSFTLTSTSSISGTGDVLFSGATVVDAGSYTITGTTMTTGGSVMFTKPFVSATPLDVASILAFAGGFTQNSGTTTLDGGTLMSMNGINIGGGSVTGSGTLSGAVSNSGAISPGTPTQFGDVMVSGDFTQTQNGVINIRVGSPVAGRGRQSATASDVVYINGVAHLAGTLNVMVPTGTAVSDVKVMSYKSKVGFFQSVLGVMSPNRVVVGPTDITLSSDPTGSLPAGVRMVSAPYDFLTSGQTAADLFQVSPLSDGTMPIATYDPTKPGYLYYPQLPGTQTKPGRGYWIELSAPKTFTAVGNPVPSPFVETLSPGWNMIGDPFPKSVDVSTLQFSVGVAVGSNPANNLLSFSTATSAGLVDTTLYGYSGTGYAAATTLQPYTGYWIYIDPATSQNQSVQVTFTQQ